MKEGGAETQTEPRNTRTTRKLFPLRLDRGEGQGEVSKLSQCLLNPTYANSAIEGFFFTKPLLAEVDFGSSTGSISK